MNRLLLVRHGPTQASVRRAFPTDESLTPAGLTAAAELSRRLPDGAHIVTSPALRCRETAAAAGLTPDVDERLAECDFGSWAGLTLAEASARDPAGVTAWITDPGARPHSGESLSALVDRVTAWLADQHADATVAITHGGVIRAAVTSLLGHPLSAAWQISAAPLSITELVREDRAWHLVANHPPATGRE